MIKLQITDSLFIDRGIKRKEDWLPVTVYVENEIVHIAGADEAIELQFNREELEMILKLFDA